MTLKNKKMKQISVYYILPILFIVAVVPLIVHLKVIKLDELTKKNWLGSDENMDFFSYYKAVFTIALSILAIIIFFIARNKKVIETKQILIYYIPIAIYGFFIIISTVFSKYPITSYNGFADRYEGMYVLLAYLIILFTTINLVNNERFIKIIIAGLFLSAFVIGTIGIFQFFGMDLFKSGLGKELMLSAQYRGKDLNFTFGAYTIYSTLYNTNFVGSYMAILLPLAIAAFLYAKRIPLKITAGIFSCLMFANWLGCRSRAGYIAGIFALIALLILFRKNIVERIKSVALLFVCFIAIFIGMNYAANGELGGRIFTGIANIDNYTSVNKTGKIAKLLKDIKFSENKVSIIYGADTLNMELNGGQVIFNDTNEKPIEIKNNTDDKISFEDPRYSAYIISFDKSQNIFDMNVDTMNFLLYVEPTGFKIIGEQGILLDKFDHPEYFGFNGMEKFASGRGYIWSRSIPILKNNILFGGGPDTYVLQFPQHDYIGKLRGLDKVNEIVDKPHNMYLQIGINTGVVSLIAFIFLLVIYLVTSLRLYFIKEDLDENHFVGAALTVAVLGYCIAGFANDSLVSVAPVFWVVFGLGISCNYLNIKTKERVAVLNAKTVSMANKGTKLDLNKIRHGKNA